MSWNYLFPINGGVKVIIIIGIPNDFKNAADYVIFISFLVVYL